MSVGRHKAGDLLATIDMRELESIHWTFMRPMFPTFADEIELGKHLQLLLMSLQCGPVRLEPHREPDGHLSTHIVDVYQLGDSN
jgi:hypothetical protein